MFTLIQCLFQFPKFQDKTAKAKHEYQTRIFRPSLKNKDNADEQETNKSNNSTDKKTKTIYHRSGSKNKQNQESSQVNTKHVVLAIIF